jgi:hypothetical protein
MRTEAPSGQPNQPPSSRQQLADAFQTAVKAEAERKAAEAAERRRGPRKPWAAIVSLLVLAAVAGWLVVQRPTWLFRPPPQESVQQQDAGLRLTMYVAAMRLRQHRQGHAEYPARLAELEGVATRDLQYERVGNDAWVMRGRRGPVFLMLRSSDSLPGFLGTSLSAYMSRGGR